LLWHFVDCFLLLYYRFFEDDFWLSRLFIKERVLNLLHKHLLLQFSNLRHTGLTSLNFLNPLLLLLLNKALFLEPFRVQFFPKNIAHFKFLLCQLHISDHKHVLMRNLLVTFLANFTFPLQTLFSKPFTLRFACLYCTDRQLVFTYGHERHQCH